MATSKTYPSLTADEAAALIPNGAMVAVSGFTPAGAPKVVPRALAKRVRELHQAGAAFQVKLLLYTDIWKRRRWDISGMICADVSTCTSII
jgi:acyl-CoA hydrolase